MLRTSLVFLAIAAVGLVLADIEVSTLEPWFELRRMLVGALTPNLLVLWDFRTALLNTLVFALCGLALGLLLGGPLSLLYQFAPIRMACAGVRAVHEIFWAFIFLPLVGLNPLCGVLAIGIPYAGVFAKVFAEIVQEADRRPAQALPGGTDGLSRFFYGFLPLVLPSLKSYASYRFECALRSSAILGFIGLPTLGFHLETAFREGLYSEAAAMLYAFYFLIYSLKWWVKPRLVPLWTVGAFVLLAKDISVHWENIARFSREILPWPMRRQGFYDGTQRIQWTPNETLEWFFELFENQALTGIWDTVVLTQIALGFTGLFSILAFPLLSRHFFGSKVRGLSNIFMIVGRTTPEYVLAYIFVQLLGPSMLPAILAIALHNGAILAHLNGARTNQLELRPDAPKRRLDRYAYEILPRTYGQILAFLFYRWEIIARESAILGLLGIYTLGFLIDSAISDDKLDQALVLIGFSAAINIAIDSLSQILRRRLQLSVGEIRAG